MALCWVQVFSRWGHPDKAGTSLLKRNWPPFPVRAECSRELKGAALCKQQGDKGQSFSGAPQLCLSVLHSSLALRFLIPI